MLVQLAPIIDGKPDVTKISAIDLEELGKKFRWQKIVFEQASQVYDQMKPGWKGNKEYLLAQLIRLVEQFISSGKIEINPPLFNRDDLRRRILITLNMSKAVQHIWGNIISDNTESRVPIFDTERPILSTGDMRTWFTGKPCEYSEKSHINFCAYDSTWEATEAFELDGNPNVAAWVKNDHLGFEVHYIYQGVVHKYRPDFLIRLKNGTMLALETKGQESDQDTTKRASLDEWVKAVNEQAEFGTWSSAVSRSPGDVAGIVQR